MNHNKKYSEYLNKLKKDELVKLVNYYHKLCEIYGNDKAVDITKRKKKEIIEYLVDIHERYIKFFVMSLDKTDLINLKSMIRKDSTIGIEKTFEAYLNEIKILFNGEIATETIDFLKKYFKNKNVIKIGKENNISYKIADGIILAYGVVDIKTFKSIVGDKFSLIENYYKKDYVIDSKKVYSKKITNKKKINNYLKNKKYKEFSNKDFWALGNNIYHHRIKSYKKFIKILKRNYIFKNHDIIFVDDMIITPYLYNSLADEKNAKKKLEKEIIHFFEFKDDRLKKIMLENVTKVRKEFPIWEYRGFASIEVK